MVQLIVGKKGKGKTKCLLDKANGQVKAVLGNVVYLYELNNKVRLIDVSEYFVENPDEFIGFITGIISQDHDLQQMYFDSFLNIAGLEDKDITTTIERLNRLSEKFHVDFTLSVSIDASELSEAVKPYIETSL